MRKFWRKPLAGTDPFETAHLSTQLRERSVKSGAFTAGSQVTKFAVNIAATMILARVLTPSDFGLLASLMPAIGFAALFKDLGLSMATIQKPRITHEQVSTMFWLNVAVSIPLVAILCLTAPLIAMFYDDARVAPVLTVLSFTFLVSGLAVQHQALLERKMRFASISVIDVVSVFASAAIGVVMALMGFGYWSLISMSLAAPLIHAPLTWYAVGWIPGRPRFVQGIGEMVRMGGHLTGFSVLNYVGRNADNVMIAKVWGSSEVGLYSKAYSLLLLPLQQITSPIAAVTVPALCTLNSEPERYRSYYKNALTIVTVLSLPLVTFIFCSSHPIVELVLGKQWLKASAIFEYLCIASFLQAVYTTVGWIYKSTGRLDRMFKWSILSLALTIVGFLVGVNYGAVGVAASYSIVNAILFVPALVYAVSGTPVRMVDVWDSIKIPLFVSALILVLILPVRLLAQEFYRSIAFLLYSIPVATICWLISNRYVSTTKAWLGPFEEMISLLRKRAV